MAENRQNLIYTLVILFVFVIIGVTLLITLANSIRDITETISTTNESLDIISARVADGNISLGFNSSINLSLTHTILGIQAARWANDSVALVEDTDWNKSINSNGTITGINIINSSQMATAQHNATKWDYTYAPINYVYDSTARTLTVLIIVFFAIGILIVALHYSGILDIGKLLNR